MGDTRPDDPVSQMILFLAKDEEAANEHLAKHANEIMGDAELLHRCSPQFARGFLSAIRVDYSGDLHAMLSRPVSMSGLNLDGGFGSSMTCIMSTSIGRSLVKGSRPVESS